MDIKSKYQKWYAKNRLSVYEETVHDFQDLPRSVFYSAVYQEPLRAKAVRFGLVKILKKDDLLLSSEQWLPNVKPVSLNHTVAEKVELAALAVEERSKEPNAFKRFLIKLLSMFKSSK